MAASGPEEVPLNMRMYSFFGLSSSEGEEAVEDFEREIGEETSVPSMDVT